MLDGVIKTCKKKKESCKFVQLILRKFSQNGYFTRKGHIQSELVKFMIDDIQQQAQISHQFCLQRLNMKTDIMRAPGGRLRELHKSHPHLTYNKLEANTNPLCLPTVGRCLILMLPPPNPHDHYWK